MKIVYVITQGDTLGGASVHLLELARGAQAAGWDVTVLAGGDGILFDRLAGLGITAAPLRYMQRALHPLKDALAVLELRRHLIRLRPDIVHLHSSKAGVLGRLAARTLSIPALFTAHGWAFTEGISTRRRWIYTRIERYMSRFSAHIIAVSDYDRRLALEKGVCTSEKISTVHNGVPDSGFATIAARTPRPDESTVGASLAFEPGPPKPQHRVRFVMVARFDEQKDQASLIRAMAAITAPTWQLAFAGDGPKLAEAQALANELGIQDRVCFHGRCDDIPALLQEADVFVLTSRWEGLPLSILEAMRAALPVIASDVGGVRETVENGVNGYLVAREDTQAIQDAARRLINDPALRRRLGDKGRERYESAFTYERMLDATLALYQQHAKHA